jgi:N-acetylmuramoyl-L-alanine amidase
VVAAPALIPALGGSITFDGAWAEIEIARQPFRLLLGAPYYRIGSAIKPLVGAASLKRDTLFLPIQFVTQVLPAELKERYRYNANAGRLEELGVAPPTTVAKAAASATRDSRTLPNGLNRGHVVTIDPGHGGVDPGNPGLFFPRGTREKHVTLQMGLLVRQELLKRGVGVIMTRTTDTLIDLYDRGSYCTDRCGLFVSLHVNSLPRRAGYTKARGFETYFLANAKTEDAARVAQMENEAIRFEQPAGQAERMGGLDFILKDLQSNEYLRESARLAELIQSHAAEIHTGPDKGVKQAGLVVLTTARRPAVLFEMGFSTNPDDAKMMTEPRSQKNLAASIADAIVSYLLEYQRRIGAAPVETETGAQRE